MIDLRSDTVTKPSPEMRHAMAEAVVGDDVFLEDPTLNTLQDRAAEIFDREAALFVPSGSMGNLVSVMAQTHPGQEVICETNGHVYNYEMASLAAVAGVLPRIVQGVDGLLSWDAVSAAIRPKVYYRPQTALVCLENTVNMAGGTVYPTAVVEEICGRAHEQNIKVHLDGARVFNAATYLKEDVASMTRPFDSVQFCLSKGLGAPVGSMIVGTREFIERCRSIRKMLGGGMRQAGVLAAAGLIALEKGRSGCSRIMTTRRSRAAACRGSRHHAGRREGGHEHRDFRPREEPVILSGIPEAPGGTARAGGAGRRRSRADGNAPGCHARRYRGRGGGGGTDHGGSMRSYAKTLACGVAFVCACAAGITAQAPNTIAAHMAAAKTAADDSWLILYSELCGAAMGAGGRASSAAAPAPDGAAGRGRQAGPPPRDSWYHDPVKVFDNMFVFPTNDVNAWAIKTSAGIIMIDATYDYSVKDLITDAMPKVGLDPKDIKYVVVTHGHGDHSAGAKFLQDTYGAKILMSEADWTMLAQPARGAVAGAPVPKKEIVVADGQKLTLGDTTITMYLTPGHTLGTISLMIPVKDNGKTHMAAFWGGTAHQPHEPLRQPGGVFIVGEEVRDRGRAGRRGRAAVQPRKVLRPRQTDWGQPRQPGRAERVHPDARTRQRVLAGGRPLRTGRRPGAKRRENAVTSGRAVSGKSGGRSLPDRRPR